MKTETRKEEIIKTAATLFKEKGYSAVTMRDLATAMGMKAASLYNHISSKQEILKEIIISLAEEFTEGIEVIYNSNSNSLDKLSQIIALHVKITTNNTSGMASLNNDWMHLEDQLAYYLKLRNNYEAIFLSIIKEGISASEIKNLNPETIMFSMLSTLRSLFLWIPKKEALNANDLANNLSAILIQGINK
ncbi:TetR/AcrR family transcriptional regulator [Lacinutrix sp. C3R15]|uniref:TetR/AcrR family transcriptional regulator n=1 Tax=Flavobacteriaceae TaxID=49546 RepID=UPI001C09D50E|nr:MULTISPECIES: TetR/AcrR family transcriptional regulator [Flavobacteriaceae]MBU2939740.1 TetR/AcrR family transcriptional regulator [Lacinutrix sp. C3R15]MDO6623055.1 TetR/AcrR family transcriptional regulator [Oceanihabitans sp. 1_MG-2023]